MNSFPDLLFSFSDFWFYPKQAPIRHKSTGSIQDAAGTFTNHPRFSNGRALFYPLFLFAMVAKTAIPETKRKNNANVYVPESPV